MSKDIQHSIPGTAAARFVGQDAPDEGDITQRLLAQFEIEEDGPRQTPSDVQLRLMTDVELVQLSKMIEVERRNKVYRQKQRALQDVKRTLRRYDMDIDDVIGKGPKGKRNPPKYGNPEDITQTWTGRGRHPKWYKEALERGYSQDDMLIR